MVERKKKFYFPWVTQTREITPFCNPLPCNLCYMGINPIKCVQPKVMTTIGWLDCPNSNISYSHIVGIAQIYFSHAIVLSIHTGLVGCATIEHTCKKFGNSIPNLIKKNQHSDIPKVSCYALTYMATLN